MLRLAETCERIAATTKKLQKTAIVADYLRSRELRDAAISAVFLSGRAFPAFDERTLQIGGSLLWKLVVELADNHDAALRAAYRKRGDLGSAAYDVLLAKAPTSATITLQDVRATFDQIADTRTATAKASVLKSLLERATALEVKYILKIITGELRIGLKESLVEEAIAKAYDEPLVQVQRANMLLGDIGATLQLAAEHRLDQARMRLFHPIGFMLASPAADAAEAFQYFEHAQVEDKYDGIRAQAHCGGGQVRIFSRTLDEVTPSFPELVGGLSELPGEVILDGEIVAWRNHEDGGHAMPFSEIQKRLGRKQVSQKMMAEVPIAYVVFDVIYAEDELTLDKPLSERAQILERVFAGAKRVSPRPVVNAQGSLLFEPEIEEEGAVSGWVLRAPTLRADSPEQLEQYFDEAMARGNEGLMIKDLQSPYMPGRRGRWWLKLKRELATLDVVVTRRGVRPRQAHPRAQRLHLRGAQGRRTGQHRQSLFRTDRQRDCRTDRVVSGAHHRGPWSRARGRAQYCAGGGVQRRYAFRSSRQRIRAALSADRARAPGQTTQGHRHRRDGGKDLCTAAWTVN